MSCLQQLYVSSSEANMIFSYLGMGSLTPFLKKNFSNCGTYSVSRQPSVHCFGDYDRCFESRWSAGKKKIKRGILLAAVHITDNCKETTFCELLNFFFKLYAIFFCICTMFLKYHSSIHIMKTVTNFTKKQLLRSGTASL